MTDCDTDFDDWIVAEHGRRGDFTMLFVLVAIRAETGAVDIPRGAWLHVVGPDLRWPEMAAILANAGADWSGAAFFAAGAEGLVPDPTARERLAALGRALHEDRRLIRKGAFFNQAGLALRLDDA